jgi:hypothetical protein
MIHVVAGLSVFVCCVCVFPICSNNCCFISAALWLLAAVEWESSLRDLLLLEREEDVRYTTSIQDPITNFFFLQNFIRTRRKMMARQDEAQATGELIFELVEGKTRATHMYATYPLKFLNPSAMVKKKYDTSVTVRKIYYDTVLNAVT